MTNTIGDDVLTILILILILPFLLPDLDIDGDGYGAKVEAVAGCSNLDRESFPHCLPGAEVTGGCSDSIPGAEMHPC